MKVLLINGSPRKNGNTFTALSEIANTLKTEGIESEIVWIGNKPIRGCIACGTCKTKGNGRCIFDDDVCNSISAKFAESDGFVFGSPVYYGQPNGALLSIMQRAFFSNGAQLQNKPAAVVTICRRGGATAAFEALQMPSNDEYAVGNFAILEHRLRPRGRANGTRHRGHADDAHSCTQPCLDDSRSARRKRTFFARTRTMATDAFYSIVIRY